MRLLEGQDLFNALASYYELAFVFQLKYSKHCQTTAQIMQLKVLEYGDIELGGLTSIVIYCPCTFGVSGRDY